MRQELSATTERAATSRVSELQEQLAISRLVIEHAADAVFLLNQDGATVYANPAAETMFGWSKSELQGRKLHEVLHYQHPDGRPFPMDDCPLGLVFFSGKSLHSHEDTFFHKDGHGVPVACSNAPVLRDGVVEGGVLIVRDISEARRAQQTLLESEARLTRALEAGELGAWELDMETLAAWRSPQHDRIFGYEAPLPEWSYDTFIGHVVPEDRDLVNSRFEETIASQGRWDFECRIRRADGELRWIWAQGRIDSEFDGKSQRMKGMVRDVTERRLTEEALRELNETLEQQVAHRTAERNRVWEMSRDLLAVMGFDGTLKAINPAWETTFGRDSKTLLSLSFREQVHPDDHPAVIAVMEQLVKGETVERFEDRIRHADGSWRWISWTLVPGQDVFYAVGRDVTAEKEAAAELERAQEALRQSQKMEAMGQLTGGVAHDFNNLLTPIVGSLDMLQRKGLGGPREQRLINGAMQSADRAKTLVQRLLAFARRQPLQSSAVNVGKLVTGMANLIASTSGPQIHVVVVAADGLPPANADPNSLRWRF